MVSPVFHYTESKPKNKNGRGLRTKLLLSHLLK